jgi:threonyl-tRNA synthetase
MLIVGEKEATEKKLAVRQQGKGDLGTFTISDFKDIITNTINQSLENFNNLS